MKECHANSREFGFLLYRRIATNQLYFLCTSDKTVISLIISNLVSRFRLYHKVIYFEIHKLKNRGPMYVVDKLVSPSCRST